MPKNLSLAFRLDPSFEPEAVHVYTRALENVDDAPFTYIELRTAVRALVEKGLSERDALMSVFVTAETLGRDRHSLLKSTEDHLEALERENDQIMAAMSTRLTEGLAAERKAIEDIRGKQRDIRQQIDQLQRQLADAEEEEKRLNGELGKVKGRVEAQGERLQAVFEAFRKEISADLASMRAA